MILYSMAEFTLPRDVSKVIKTDTPKKGAPVSKPPAEKYRFRSNQFLFEQDSGIPLTTNRKDAKEVGIKSEFISIDERTTAACRKFLTDYMNNLTRFAEKNLDIIDSPGHEDEKLLLNLLGDPDPDKRIEKIEDLLKSPEGWKMAILANEMTLSKNLQSLAITESSDKPSVKDHDPSTGTVHTGVDQGRGNKLWNEKVKPKLTKRNIIKSAIGGVGVMAVTGTGTAIGNLTTGYDNGGPAGAVGAVGIMGIGIGLKNTMKSGRTFEIRYTPDLLRQIQGDANEKKYIDQMYGINVDDYVIQPDGSIKLVEPKYRLSQKGATEKQHEIDQAIELRQMFYSNLGVPLSKLDRLPEEFIFEEGEMEQLGTYMQKRLSELFDPRANLIAGDTVGNIKRFNEARQKLMIELGTNYIAREEDRNFKLKVQPLSTIHNKITARTENDGSIYIKERAAFNAEKDALTESKNHVQSLSQEIDQYDQALKELTDLKNSVTLDFASLPGADIDAKRNYIFSKLNKATPPTGLSIEEAMDDNRTYETRTLPGLIAGIPVGTPAKERDALIQAYARQVKSEAENIKTKLEAEIAKYKEQLRDLDEAKLKVEAKQQQLTDTETLVVQVEKHFKTIEDDFADILGISFGGISISNIDLATLSQKDLLEKINTIYESAPPPPPPKPGWGKEDNDSKRRAKVLNATIQAKAEQRAARDPHRTDRRIFRYDTIRTWGVTENQLRTLTKDQLHKIVNRRYALGGGGWDPANNAFYENYLDDVITEAKLQFDAKKSVLNEIPKEIDQQIEEQESLIKRISHEDEITKLETTYDLLSRQEDVFKGVGKLADGKEVDRYVDNSPVVGTTFTQAEITTPGVTKGYLEIMNMLFNYKERDDRNSYFEKITKLLPPDTLADFLNIELSLGKRRLAGGAVNTKGIFTEFGKKVQDNTIDRRQIRKAMVKLMDRFKDEALSLP